MPDPAEPVGREARLRRKAWPIRVVPLGAESDDDLSGSTTAEERLAMMWPLACEAWATMGRPIPDYPRTQAPVRVVRGSPAA